MMPIVSPGQAGKNGHQLVTMEKSPNYLYVAHPQTVKHFLPQANIVVLLRDPVDRMFSNFLQKHRSVVGRYDAFSFSTFDAAIRAAFAEFENTRLCKHGDVNKLTIGELTECVRAQSPLPFARDAEILANPRHYLCKGAYAVWLKRWMAHFSLDDNSLIVYNSDDFFNDMDRVLADVTRRVGLQPVDWTAIRATQPDNIKADEKVHTLAELGIAGMSDDERALLTAFYTPVRLVIFHLLFIIDISKCDRCVFVISSFWQFNRRLEAMLGWQATKWQRED